MGCERSWQVKSVFSADKPLGDTYPVIWVGFNDSFSFWPWICRGLTAPLSQTALCILPLASLAALPYQCGHCLHPRTDHSFPKPALLYRGNCCETLERKCLIFISMKIKIPWRPSFPSCSGQAEPQPLLAVLGVPREC